MITTSKLTCTHCGRRIFWDRSHGKAAFNLLYREHGNDTTICTDPSSNGPHVPISRSSELFYLLSLPTHLDGLRIVEVGRWTAGGEGTLSGAKVIFFDEHAALQGRAPFTVATLYYNDQTSDDTQPLVWHAGHYDIATLERAREIARKS